MLRVTIPSGELWDEEKQEFIYSKEQTLQLEHSLISISKWESKWCKFFFSKEEKTPEEVIDYVRCMTLTQNVNPRVYQFLTNRNIQQIRDYIEAPMTATRLPERKGSRGNREQVSSELIYYWMTVLNIPFECQKWHLNRLLTLVQICNIKNAPPKRRSKREIMQQNAKLNAERRKRLHTKG